MQVFLFNETGNAGIYPLSLHDALTISALTRLGIASLDLLVITHADEDHVGAGGALADRALRSRAP